MSRRTLWSASPRKVAIFGVLALLAAMAGLATALARSQESARKGLETRFDSRIELTARFAARYVDEIFEREQRVALARLAAPAVAQSDFDVACDALGFEAAVLLDAKGRVLAVRPAKPALLGVDLTPKYPHLAAAVAGKRAVSGVTPSAARGTPIVAFALPFDSTAGRRVFSGGADVQRSPLGAYIADSIPIRGRDVLVVDRTGAIAASAGPSFPVGSEQTTRLALQRSFRGSAGSASVKGRPTHYRSVSVSSTPLTIVGMAPVSEITRPVSGAAAWLPWAVLAIAAAMAGGILALLVRLVEARGSLTRANAELDAVSRHDRLTGLYNRRHLEEILDAAVRSSARSGDSVAVLMVDLDRFKEVNDRLGHPAGDVVLRAVADRLAAGTRAEDVVGRWGGEEFLVVLPHATAPSAGHHAERLRAAVASAPVVVDGDPVAVTVSVGCAGAAKPTADELIQAADAALYEAKAQGRNRVVVAGPSVVCPECRHVVPLLGLRLRLREGERSLSCPHCASTVPLALLESASTTSQSDDQGRAPSDS